MFLNEGRKYSWCRNSQERRLSFPFYSGRVWNISPTQGKCLEELALRAKWFNKWQVSKIFHGHPPFLSLAKPTVRVENCRCTVWCHKELCTGVSFWDMDVWKSDHVVFVEFVLHPSPPQLFISRLFYSLFPSGVPREWGLCFIYQEPGLTEA